MTLIELLGNGLLQTLAIYFAIMGAARKCDEHLPTVYKLYLSKSLSYLLTIASFFDDHRSGWRVFFLSSAIGAPVILASNIYIGTKMEDKVLETVAVLTVFELSLIAAVAFWRGVRTDVNWPVVILFGLSNSLMCMSLSNIIYSGFQIVHFALQVPTTIEANLSGVLKSVRVDGQSRPMLDIYATQSPSSTADLHATLIETIPISGYVGCGVAFQDILQRQISEAMSKQVIFDSNEIVKCDIYGGIIPYFTKFKVAFKNIDWDAHFILDYATSGTANNLVVLNSLQQKVAFEPKGVESGEIDLLNKLTYLFPSTLNGFKFYTTKMLKKNDYAANLWRIFASGAIFSLANIALVTFILASKYGSWIMRREPQTLVVQRPFTAVGLIFASIGLAMQIGWFTLRNLLGMA